MKNITKQLSILLFALIFINHTQGFAQECKTTPKVKTVNVACDLTVERGVCLFAGRTVVISTELNNVTNIAASLEIVVADCKGNKKTFNASSKLNDATGTYDASFLIPISKGCLWSLDSIVVTLVNSCGDKYSYGQSARLDAPFTNFALLLNGKNRPAKYGQCWVFSKSAGGNGGNVVPLDELSVTQTYSEEGKAALFGVVIALNSTKEKDVENLESLLTWGEAKLSAVVTVEYENGKTETKTIQAKFDSETGRHFLSDQFSGGHIRTPRITKIQLNFTNTCNETFTLETEYQSGYTEPTSNFHVWTETWSINQKTKVEDVCDVKYKAENTMFNINDEKDVIAIYISIGFKEDGDVPSSIKAIVEMVNCKNESVYISMEMKANDKEPWMWSSSQAIFQKVDCSLSFVGIKYIAVSSCKEEFTGEAIIPEGQLKKAKSGMRLFVAKLNFATTTDDVLRN